MATAAIAVPKMEALGMYGNLLKPIYFGGLPMVFVCQILMTRSCDSQSNSAH